VRVGRLIRGMPYTGVYTVIFILKCIGFTTNIIKYYIDECDPLLYCEIYTMEQSVCIAQRRDLC